MFDICDKVYVMAQSHWQDYQQMVGGMLAAMAPAVAKLAAVVGEATLDQAGIDVVEERISPAKLRSVGCMMVVGSWRLGCGSHL